MLELPRPSVIRVAWSAELSPGWAYLARGREDGLQAALVEQHV